MAYKKSSIEFNVGEVLRFKTDRAARRCMADLTIHDELRVVKTGISVIRCELADGEHILVDSWEFKDLERVPQEPDIPMARDKAFLLTMMTFAVDQNDESYFHELANELNNLKEG